MIKGNDLLEPFTFDEAIGLHQRCEKLGIVVTEAGEEDILCGFLRMRPRNVESGPDDMVFASVKEALIFAKGLDAAESWLTERNTGRREHEMWRCCMQAAAPLYSES